MAVPKVIFDRRLGMASSAVLLYLALFVVITYTLGKGMAIASIIPVVVIAWMYGFWAGIWAGALSAPVNIGLFMLMGLDWVGKFYMGGVGVAGTLIELFVGAIVGKLHEYYKRLQEELGVRKALEAELQQHRTRLEEMVQAKTVELAASNQQLRATLEQLQASQSDLQQARDFMNGRTLLKRVQQIGERLLAFSHHYAVDRQVAHHVVGEYGRVGVAEGDVHGRTALPQPPQP